jgi:hypothetical protein
MQALADVKGQLAAYSFPQHLGGYTYTGSAAFPTPLEYAGADRIDVGAYQRGDETLYVAAVRYERDRPGHKFVSQSNRPYSFDWNRVGGGAATVADLKVSYDDLRPKIRLGAEPGAAPGFGPEFTGPWRVYSWYAVAGHTTPSAVKAKLLAVLDWRLSRSVSPPPAVLLVATRPDAASATDAVAMTVASSR